MRDFWFGGGRTQGKLMVSLLKRRDLDHSILGSLTRFFVNHLRGRNAVVIVNRATRVSFVCAAWVVIDSPGGGFLLMRVGVCRVSDLLGCCGHLWWVHRASLWWHRRNEVEAGSKVTWTLASNIPLLNRVQMPPHQVFCGCQKCKGQKKRAQQTIKKHLELYGLAQNPADDGGNTDWSVLSDDQEADNISVYLETDYHLPDTCQALPGIVDLGEYDNFAPMTLDDTEDDGDWIPNNHEGYLEWYEAIESGDDAEWFNFPHEIDAQMDEASDPLSDQEDDMFDLDNMIQWLRDEYDVELMCDGACLAKLIHFGTGMEILTREALPNLKFFAIWFHSRIARNTYEAIRATFEEELRLRSGK